MRRPLTPHPLTPHPLTPHPLAGAVLRERSDSDAPRSVVVRGPPESVEVAVRLVMACMRGREDFEAAFADATVRFPMRFPMRIPMRFPRRIPRQIPMRFPMRFN